MSKSSSQTPDRSLLLCVALFIATLAALYLRNPAQPIAKDSASSLTVVATADLMGNITPIECTTSQPGGLARRATAINQCGDPKNLIIVDAGGAATGERPFDLALLEITFRCEMATHVAAHNIGANEANLPSEKIRELINKTGIPLVSSNLRTQDGNYLTEPVRVIEKNGNKVTILGLLSPAKAPKHLTAEEPAKAIREMLEQYQSSSSDNENLIVLADLATEQEMKTIANILPSGSLLILRRDQENSVHITKFEAKQNSLNRISLVIPPAQGDGLCKSQRYNSKSTKLWETSVISLEPQFASDNKIEKLIASFSSDLARNDFTADQCSIAKNLDQVRMFERDPSARSDAIYAGSSSCIECHQDQADRHLQSPHAHAWQALVERRSHFDSRCQSCHTTGFGEPSGFTSVKSSPRFTSVGCESCHGPSLKHSLSPMVKTAFDAMQSCGKCHTSERSPGFDPEEGWLRVGHGKAN
jgi:hypothetical protein